MDGDNLAMLSAVDTILLGRKTYQMFVDYWPAAQGELVADAVNSIPKIVYSSTLTLGVVGEWEPARLVAGGATDHVHDLRTAEGADIVVWGSVSLAQTLFRAGAVDELQLRVVPLLIGSGRICRS